MPDDTPPESYDELAAGDGLLATAPVEVRRHAGVAALIGAAASAVAIAYLWRAAQTMAVLDWTVFALMAAVAGVYLVSLVDARTPLLVADDLGVRIRLGNEWRGLPWDAIGQVVVHPRRGLLRDGRLVFSPHSLSRALDGLDARGRRHVALNQKMYGAALAVPVGLTTRVSTDGDRGVVAKLSALARGRADVVELEPELLDVVEPAEPAAPTASPAERPAPTRPDAVPDVPTGSGARTQAGTQAVEPDSAARVRAPRRSILGGLATIVSRVAKGRDHDVDTHHEPADEPLVPAAVPASLAVPAHLRETRPGLRAEATLDLPTQGSAALQPHQQDSHARNDLPEGRELRRPGSVPLVIEPVALDPRVRPISLMGDPVEPLVIDDFVTEPAYDPVIGPELAAARTRIGLSVDELAERTRIRPHVIESIEVDDFAPCGGDFYARGHLRTLARILGKDPVPLLEAFEKRYATAPINARRVFEAELATGMTGSMRATSGGPNWSLLVGVVISLVLVWGVVRLFTTEPVDMVEMPAPVLDGSAGLVDGYPAAGPGSAAAGPGEAAGPVAEPVPVRLSASQSDSAVVVRDGEGRVVFSGRLVLGERKTLKVYPPVRVTARNGGAVEVTVRGRDRGLLGELGEPARRTFR